MRFISVIVLYFLLSQLPQFGNNITAGPNDLLIKADTLLGKNNLEAIKIAKLVRKKYFDKSDYYVKASLVLGIGYKNLGKYDTSLYYTNEGLKRALENKDTVNIIKLYSSKGVVNFLRAGYSKSIENFKKAVKFYEQYGYKSRDLSPLHFAKILNNVASAYSKTGQSDSALKYFIRSYDIRQNNNAPKRMLIVSKMNIGSIYLAVADYENSKQWMSTALQCAIDTKDSALMEKCYTNLGIVYKNLGDTLKAIENYNNGLAISEKLGNYRDQAVALQNLALLYGNLKKFNETRNYLYRALAINNKIKANNSGVHLGLAKLFYEKKDYDSAVYHGKLAVKLASESGDISNRIEGLDLLFKAYKATKEFAKALVAHEQYDILQDSMINSENRKYIQNLKTKFETEKKEKEIELLKKLNEIEISKAKAVQSRQKLIIVSVLLSLILVIVLAISIVLKRKRDKQMYLVEKKLLETELRNKDIKSKELQMEIVYKTKQLTTHALNMMQRNQMLTDIKNELQSMSKKMVDENKSELKHVIKEINQIQKTEKDWDLFKKYFESVNKDFSKKLHEINPGLTINDYRLAALISLNLNIKETAAVLNITPNSVKLARHRLRKKLNLGNGDDLYTFLSNI